ncbi:MAG: dihydroorotase [Hymenobacteraceae bacterium]|nr:dihydroorotase [Hymenobacteraceae bacterium]MDX5395579.1 dihydroorotase [Hymenobacteraceae bacterium]MDX5443286.1 dihydroorotase [Hymenobacteraceae bacterium]MDX5511631.1 dihydroorotase [Hymenobacteraceae bacterium]
MDILLKSVRIIDPASELHNQVTSVYIKDGVIATIGNNVPDNAASVLQEEGLCVSAGWFDMQAMVGEPGLEYKEDLQSAAQAAAAGGFTEVLCLPNTEPVVQTKHAVSYLQSKTAAMPVTFHAMAAVTTDAGGKELTEMIDLHQAGAIAFSDGFNGLQNADVLLKALHYVQFFDGLLINKPENARLNEYGQMHEGVVSTQLGMKGLPALSEELTVARDLQLLEYAGGKLHFSLVSSAGSVELIRKAKEKGLEVTCGAATYQVAFTDATMSAFDSNFKVNPPFRSAADVEALVQGLQDGTIDVLVSGHTPQDAEAKNLEFDLADFGIINLETAFAVANTHLKDQLNLESLITKLVHKPRQILNLPVPEIKVGAVANLTVFHPEKTWVPMPAQTQSRSLNSPFFGQTLTGKVAAIVNKGQAVFNPNF